jgi:hypothetical protein
MNFFKTFLIVLIIMVNLVVAQPSFADKPKFTKNPDYIEITQALDNLLQTRDTQAEVENYTPEEAQKRIDELKFQKYIFETGIDWGQCRNETGKTLAVYGPKPKIFDDDDYLYDNGLYFLADGYATKTEWDCDGIYLPSDVSTTGINPEGRGQELSGPVAVKIGDGTQLVVETTPDTPSVEFNTPLTKVFKAGEVNWFIPNVPQAVINTRVANAPAVKIAKRNPLSVQRNPEQDTVESNQSDNPPKTQSQDQAQPQPKPQWRPNLPPQAGYFKRT